MNCLVKQAPEDRVNTRRSLRNQVALIQWSRSCTHAAKGIANPNVFTVGRCKVRVPQMPFLFLNLFSLSLPSTMPLKLGILVSTYSLIVFNTLTGVRCWFGGLLLTSLNPICGTCLAKSSCAMLFIGVNCFQNGCLSTKSWCTARERSTVT
jgi:hypothetical protein